MDAAPARTLGRYALFDVIASGGMGSVHLGRLLGQGWFSRTVAIKRLLPGFATAPEFVAALLTEARLAARIRHPNVVPTLDVVSEGGEVALVMEFVLGDSLSNILKSLLGLGEMAPVSVAARIAIDALQGLHAAHEAHSDDGAPLGLIHRDVSPQNLLVGADGTTRVLDFGIAKASLESDEHTQLGALKGKLGYLAPEQLRGEAIDRRVDVYAASVVLWELLSRERLYPAGDDRQAAILRGDVRKPSSVRPEVPIALDAVVMRGLALDPADRFPTAREMAQALEAALLPASALEVSEWVEGVAANTLRERREAVRRVEGTVGVAFDEKTEPFQLAGAKFGDVTEPIPAPTPEPAPARKAGLLEAGIGLAGVLAVIFSFAMREKAPAGAGASASASAGAGASASASASAVAGAGAGASCVGRALGDVVELSAGPASHHTCARQRSGAVWCWGDNAAGQLGFGDREPHVAALRVRKLEGATQLSAGNDHVCVVDAERSVRCWGRGRLLHPAQVLDLAAVSAVAAGGRHDCALHTNGTVDCWGDDELGQLGSTSKAAALAVRVDGLPASSWVTAGGVHSCARANSGEVWCWGGNDLGQLGNGATDALPHPKAAKVSLSGAVNAVVAGDKTTFVVTAKGDVQGWGFSIKRPLEVAVHEVVQVAAGGKVNCARRRDDSVWCWGFDDAGQLGGDTAEDSARPKKLALTFVPRSLAAGESHVCALDDAGAVWCWGSNGKGELGLTPDAARHPRASKVTLGECP